MQVEPDLWLNGQTNNKLVVYSEGYTDITIIHTLQHAPIFLAVQCTPDNSSVAIELLDYKGPYIYSCIYAPTHNYLVVQQSICM